MNPWSKQALGLRRGFHFTSFHDRHCGEYGLQFKRAGGQLRLGWYSGLSVLELQPPKQFTKTNLNISNISARFQSSYKKHGYIYPPTDIVSYYPSTVIHTLDLLSHRDEWLTLCSAKHGLQVRCVPNLKLHRWSPGEHHCFQGCHQRFTAFSFVVIIKKCRLAPV